MMAENWTQWVGFCVKYTNTTWHISKNLIDVIHIDEQWFYLTQNAQKLYIGNI